MICGKYEFAGIAVEICSIYEQVHRLCRDYLSQKKPDFTVIVTQEMIDFERGEDDFDDAYLETLAVYRAFCEYAISRNVVLLHGSAVAVDREAYIFLAKSGTGKSTHTKFWREYLGARAVMINDDKPLLRFENGDVYVYGSPWQGKHNIGSNVSFPLKAVCFLERGENAISPLPFSKAYPRLCRHVYYRNDDAYLMTLFSLLDKMDKVSFYEMKCTPDIDAANMAFEKMRG